jgi:hypothetical protein
LLDIHLVRDQYSEYIKSSKILNTKRTNNPINKWAKESDSSEKKKYEWPITTGKIVEQCMLPAPGRRSQPQPHSVFEVSLG